MPDRQRVDDFLATIVRGETVKAIEDFYHEDASMQENADPPRRGRQNLIEHEKQMLARVEELVFTPVTTLFIEGDEVAFRWVIDMTDRKGVKRRLDEMVLQRWRGDRIVEERFFYDAATAAKPVEA